MPATLRIDLDNNTGEGFGDLESQLREAAGATEELNATAKAMSRTVDLSEESIKALSASFAGLSNETKQVETGMERAARETSAFRSIAENLTATIGVLGSGVFTLAKGVIAHRAEIAAAAKITQEATQTVSVYGAGIRAAVGYLTGLGPAVSVAYAEVKILGEVFDRTGIKFEETARVTEKTRIEFKKLQDEARNLGISVQTHVSNLGKTLDDFGVKAESNLDRQVKAWKRLGSEITKQLTGLRTAIVEPIQEQADEIWKSIDKQATNGTNNIVKTINDARDVYRSYVAWVTSNQEDLIAREQKENAGRVRSLSEMTATRMKYARQEMELMVQQAAATKRLNELREVTGPQFAALREWNKEREKSLKLDKELEALRRQDRPGGLQPTGYAAEQAEINRLKQKTVDEHGRATAAGPISPEAVEKYQKSIDILEAREKALEDRRKADHIAGIERIWKEQEEAKKAADQKTHDAVEASRKQWEEAERLAKEAQKKQTEEETKAIEERLAIYRYGLKQREKADAEAALKRQQQIDDLVRSFSGGPTARDTQGQAIDIERRTQEQIARLRQQQIQQYVTGDVKGFFESEKQKYEILQQSLQAQKQLRDKFLKEASPVEQIKAQITDKDLAAQIEKDRLDKLRADRAKNRPDPFANDDVVDPKEERQRARYDRETRRQEQNARRQLRRDMQRGNVGEDEVNQATNNLVKATVDRAQQEGKVGAQQAEAMNKVVEIEKQRLEQDQQREAEAKAFSEALEEVRGQLEEIGVSQRSRAMRR